MPVIRRSRQDEPSIACPVSDSLQPRPRVLHSSMAPFGGYSNRDTQDLEFPSFPRSIGVIVRAEKRSRGPETILVEQEWPTLTSVVRGEESDRDSVEKLTREKVAELILRCRSIAKELTKHAEKLERRLNDPCIVDQAGKSSLETSGAGRESGEVQARTARHDAPEAPRGGKSRVSHRAPVRIDGNAARLNRALSSEDDD